MAKPIYPFQPFIEVHISDSKDSFYDRIFIPEDLLEEDMVKADFFYDNLYKLTTKLGYPFSRETFLVKYGYILSINESDAITLITNTESIGHVTIKHTIIGASNAYRKPPAPQFTEDNSGVIFIDDTEQEEDYPEICVNSHIPEMVKLNEHRQNQDSLNSQITIMVLQSTDRSLNEDQCEWLHYHINNYMNRGYKIYIEAISDMGQDLMQYIINCHYSNCVVVLEGVLEQPSPLLDYQPLEACRLNDEGKVTVKGVMQQFATHLLDPSTEIEQTNALISLVSAAA